MTTFKSGIHFPWDLPPNDGETIEVAKGLHWIRLPLPMKIDHVNVYALDDGDGWSIVDTGIASRRTKAIWERLLSGPLSGKPVKNLIINLSFEYFSVNPIIRFSTNSDLLHLPCNG